MPLRFLADENFPTPSVTLLWQQQIDVRSVIELFPAYSDHDVLALAVQERRVLLTFDRDFGELVFHHSHNPPPGIVYFRFDPLSPTEPGSVLLWLLEETRIELTGMMTIIGRGIVRQRPLPGRVS